MQRIVIRGTTVQVLELAVVIRIDRASLEPTGDTRRLYDALRAMAAMGIAWPATWNLASSLLSFGMGTPDARDALPLLADRIARFGDQVAPTGLAGSHHVELTLSEIKACTEWCRSNPWSTGLKDTLGHTPRFMVTRELDHHRESALSVYREASGEHPAGEPFVVGGFGMTDAGEVLSMVTPEGIVVDHPVVRPEGTSNQWLSATGLAAAIRRRLRSERTHHRSVVDRMVVLIDVDARKKGGVMDSLTGLERLVRGRASRSIVPLDASWLSGSDLSTRHRGSVPQFADLSPARQEAIATLRSRRPTRIAVRQVLELTGGAPHTTIPGTTPRRRAAVHPEAIASMMGHATLVGPDFHAYFHGGAFCGIHRNGLHPGADSRAVTTMRRTVSPLPRRTTESPDESSVSCMSYESEISRGIRSESRWVDRNAVTLGDMVSTYAVVEELDALVISHTIRGSAESGEDRLRLMLMGIPIPDPDRLTAVSSHSDGSLCRYSGTELSAGGAIGMWGTAFQATLGDQTISWALVSGSGIALPWNPAVVEDPVPRLYLGGSVVVRGNDVRESIGIVMVLGTIDHPLIQASIRRQLPTSILRELNNRVTPGQVEG